MNVIPMLLSLPVELEAWLVLGYVGAVLAGARLFEAVARLHFERARRHAEAGFEYDAGADHYRCPEGERLTLYLIQEESRQALYRAEASRCNGCHLKAACTPHDEGRHLYRPLATWAETDVGRFHRRVSMLMIGVAVMFSLLAMSRWFGQPGTGLLFVALTLSLGSVARDLYAAWTCADDDLPSD